MHLKSVDYSKYIAVVDIRLLWQLSTLCLADRTMSRKDYGDKVFKTVLRRHPSASMIIIVNGYYENGVINVKSAEHQKRSSAYVGGQKKNVLYSLQRKEIFHAYKNSTFFFPKSIEQNLYVGFPEITFASDILTNERFIYQEN